MPNSLKCRLKGLVHKGLLSEKDLNRIIIVPDNATNGDMMKTLFKNAIIEERDYGVIIFSISNLPLWYANKDWWNAPYKLSELKGE